MMTSAAVAPLPTSNLAHLLLQTARRFPDRPAIIWRERTWSWAEFAARVQAAAGALAARGVRQGDRILLHARNANAVLETMFPAADAVIDEAALRTHLESRLARYKWPAHFVIWPELPKSGYGKVAKREVKLRLEDSA